ncbi:MAG TPA: hypothetical protein VIW26_05715 [Gemmatimonadales bacterium]|jgi:hypothetical protein
MLIRLKKRTDGGAALSCVRSDGTVTWQRQDGAQGRFFPLHDLTHYAVETILDLRGFYSLVAEGWDLTDFGRPWPRGEIPPEAHVVEQIVGFLDTERASGGAWSAADLNLESSYAVRDADLRRVREARRDLFARWAALPAGHTLELRFAHGEKTV